MHIHTFRYQMMVREQWIPVIEKYLKGAEQALLFLIASFYNPLEVSNIASNMLKKYLCISIREVPPAISGCVLFRKNLKSS